MSHDIWIKDGEVYIENNDDGKSMIAHAPSKEVAEAINDTQMGTEEGCPVCGETEPHEHELVGDKSGWILPIDLDQGPKFGSQMHGGHYKILLGHGTNDDVLFETDREQQAHLIHMALSNSQTDQGLVETLHLGVNRLKCQEVYGGHSNLKHKVVWMPDTEFDKIIKVLTKAGEHGLAAIMRQGYLDWRKVRDANPDS